MFIPIKFENWNRKELYEHYYGYQLTFTLQVDITDLYNYIKKENKKFYPIISWVITKTVNDDSDFRFMIRNGQIGYMDKLGTNFTVVRDSDPTLFTHGVTPYYDDVEKYYSEFQKNKKLAEAGNSLYYNASASENCVDISTTPLISFESLSLNIPSNFYGNKDKAKLSPFTCVGKYKVEGDKVILPVCTNFHHCVNDGHHIQKFFALLQKNLDIFKSFTS